jgi:hypothetical protein
VYRIKVAEEGTENVKKEKLLQLNVREREKIN